MGVKSRVPFGIEGFTVAIVSFLKQAAKIQKRHKKNNLWKSGLEMKKSVFLPRLFETPNMAVVAQLVRVPDCGSVGRRFESDLPPERLKNSDLQM